MKTIEIDEELYALLLSRATMIGESASSILRRELALPRRREEGLMVSAPTSAGSPALATFPFLKELDFLFGMNATRRFLRILEEIHQQHKAEFFKVQGIGGHKRRYFAKSKEDL